MSEKLPPHSINSPRIPESLVPSRLVKAFRGALLAGMLFGCQPVTSTVSLWAGEMTPPEKTPAATPSPSASPERALSQVDALFLIEETEKDRSLEKHIEPWVKRYLDVTIPLYQAFLDDPAANQEKADLLTQKVTEEQNRILEEYVQIRPAMKRAVERLESNKSLLILFLAYDYAFQTEIASAREVAGSVVRFNNFNIGPLHPRMQYDCTEAGCDRHDTPSPAIDPVIVQEMDRAVNHVLKNRINPGSPMPRQLQVHVAQDKKIYAILGISTILGMFMDDSHIVLYTDRFRDKKGQLDIPRLREVVWHEAAHAESVYDFRDLQNKYGGKMIPDTQTGKSWEYSQLNEAYGYLKSFGANTPSTFIMDYNTTPTTSDSYKMVGELADVMAREVARALKQQKKEVPVVLDSFLEGETLYKAIMDAGVEKDMLLRTLDAVRAFLDQPEAYPLFEQAVQRQLTNVQRIYQEAMAT